MVPQGACQAHISLQQGHGSDVQSPPRGGRFNSGKDPGPHRADAGQERSVRPSVKQLPALYVLAGCVARDSPPHRRLSPQSRLAPAVCIEHCIELSWNSFCAFFFCVPRLERQSHGASDAVSIGDPACKIGQSRVDTVMPTTACRLENSHRRGARHWRGNTRTPRQSHSVVTAGPNRTPSAAAAVTSGRPDRAGRPPPR